MTIVIPEHVCLDSAIVEKWVQDINEILAGGGNSMLIPINYLLRDAIKKAYGDRWTVSDKEYMKHIKMIFAPRMVENIKIEYNKDK